MDSKESVVEPEEPVVEPEEPDPNPVERCTDNPEGKWEGTLSVKNCEQCQSIDYRYVFDIHSFNTESNTFKANLERS